MQQKTDWTGKSVQTRYFEVALVYALQAARQSQELRLPCISNMSQQSRPLQG